MDNKLFSFLIDKQQLESARIIARVRGESISNVLRDAITQYNEKNWKIVKYVEGIKNNDIDYGCENKNGTGDE